MRNMNVFGALALLLADEIVRSASAQAPEVGPASSALALLHHEPGLSIRKLAAGVALSHAGAVRLVDRLQIASPDGGRRNDEHGGASSSQRYARARPDCAQ